MVLATLHSLSSGFLVLEGPGDLKSTLFPFEGLIKKGPDFDVFFAGLFPHESVFSVFLPKMGQNTDPEGVGRKSLLALFF